MNVGLVVPGFSADAADWCIPALRHLARTLAATDDVRVIAVRYPYRRDRYTLERAEVIALGGEARRGRETFDLWRHALQSIKAEHQLRKFDVLHAFWATESGLLAAIAGRLLGVPTLVSLAGGELVALPDIGYGDQLVAWERLKVAASLRLATAVSAGSRLLLEVAARHVPSRKLHRAPLGVDLELFKPTVQRGQHMLHVGSLVPVKDQPTLLGALALLRKHGSCATLQIVGDGPLRPRLEKLATDLGVADCVAFRGDVDHATLPSIYAAAGVFVLSSRHEAQGMVALEAAACGLPVVGTRVGVLPELTDAVAPIGDAEALALALAESAADARDRVRAEFELHACTDRFRAVYASLVSG